VSTCLQPPSLPLLFCLPLGDVCRLLRRLRK
jgi:hypothetical protein